MFRNIGRLIARHWPAVLVFWVALVAVLLSTAPPLDSVVENGEFAFLPDKSPSRLAETLFQRAFPDDLLASSIVVVVRRESRPEGLLDEDFDFVDRDDDIPPPESTLPDQSPPDDLRKSLETIAELARLPVGKGDESLPVISRIRTFRDKAIGDLLVSDGRKATLVIAELTTEFLDSRNEQVVGQIESLLADEQFQSTVPPGLDLTLSGTAVVGRDMLVAERESGQNTELLTVILVIVLLLLIYRAPVLALIPLVTVFVSVEIAMHALQLLAEAGHVALFQGVQIYVTVLVYGAGVDYCLFLIARYKEELDFGVSVEEAIESALAKTGATLTASAGTVICGVGMLIFADFGKFNQAGIAISFGLCVVLLASLTLTPAVLRGFGAWAFWPQTRTERISASTGWIRSHGVLTLLIEGKWLKQLWPTVTDFVSRRPLLVWLTTLLVMLPFAVVAVAKYDHLSYGLLSELPPQSVSVVGSKAVQSHFPAGAVAPITVLLRNDEIDFSGQAGIGAVDELSRRLIARKSDLGLSEIRTVSHPLGSTEPLRSMPPLRRRIATSEAVNYYVSGVPGLAGHVTRLDLTTTTDPFVSDSMEQLNRIEAALRAELESAIPGLTLLSVTGATASMRDLKVVTDRDQIRVDLLVTAGVLLILILLLRRPAVCVYLIFTVLFSYLATLGATFVVFRLISGEDFAGLDWKVPMFLFTILIAVGEDYNIFLMTRISEEQERYGRIEGVKIALLRTGKIISSCGIIMAGTFASLMVGSLMGMVQLGFALAFGVLLDTFVVRPLLVPAYLTLLYEGRFGPLGRFLGADETAPAAGE